MGDLKPISHKEFLRKASEAIGISYGALQRTIIEISF